MRRLTPPPMLLFALRDLLRRPGEGLLLGLAIAAVVTALAVPLLVYEGLSATSSRVLASGPSLVIRRLDSSGFVPMPAAEGIAAVKGVRGVVEARARVWGVVGSASGAVTVIGVDERACRALVALDVRCPRRGEAVAGSAFQGATSLKLRGPAAERVVRVSASLPEGSDAVGHDLVLVPEQEAAALLGLSKGLASDLAVWVYHDAEEEAIQGDLERALPWPVRITGRGEATEALLTSLGRRSGLGALAMVPAVLALVLLVVASGRQGRRGRREAAMLKAFGWTTADVLRLRSAQLVAVLGPALLVGVALALALVIWPGVPVLLNALLGWSGRPPSLALDAGRAVVLLAVVAGVVVVPLAGASLWPALRVALADPSELLDEARE